MEFDVGAVPPPPQSPVQSRIVYVNDADRMYLAVLSNMATNGRLYMIGIAALLLVLIIQMPFKRELLASVFLFDMALVGLSMVADGLGLGKASAAKLVSSIILGLSAFLIPLILVILWS